MSAGTLLLDRADIRSLLSIPDYLELVEQAFLASANGRSGKAGILHVDADAGEFHIKAGSLDIDRPYFGLKVNGGFFDNELKFDMPNIQGIILLCDARNGFPLAVMDSTQITLNRTGATTAVAARFLARPESRVATIFGCGKQGRVQLSYLAQVCPIDTAYACDLDFTIAKGFASDMSQQLGITVTAVSDAPAAVSASDVCITCTPSRRPFLRYADVPPGMFIAAIGADSPEKHELDTRLLGSHTVVVDLLEQCVHVGELHHALSDGAIDIGSVHGELAEIVAGVKSGRRTEEEVTIFDATGTALQDTAAAAAAFTRATEAGDGRHFNFFPAA